MTRVADFDFNVPPELVAQQPTPERDHSRLMVLDRSKQTITHKHFYDITDYLKPGDLLVLNDTKVIPGNLVGKKEEGGAKVEVLLVARGKGQVARRWECLVKPGKRLKVGSRVIFGKNEVIGTVIEKTDSGEQIIEFKGDLEAYMKKNGEIPLPPYINTKYETRNTKQIRNQKEIQDYKHELDKRYQTVYADKEGASAAPTAGLHFTPELLDRIRAKGVKTVYVTLHTGLATFKPIYAENIEDHKMHSEYFEIAEEAIAAVREAERVIAVGTTSVRALEAYADEILTTKAPRHQGHKGETNLYITPGYKFKIVDVMITNFHWPRTTLILLVSAFAGKDFIMKAYHEAIEQKYRFFSFGDAMLIL